METATKSQRIVTAQLEDLMLQVAADLSDGAFEQFTQGQLAQPELEQFYEILKNWATVNEEILDAMSKIGLQTRDGSGSFLTP